MGTAARLWRLARGDDTGAEAGSMIEPLYLGGEIAVVERDLAGEKVKEISEEGIAQLLKEGRELQRELCDLPLEERLGVVQNLAEIWRERLAAGELAGLKLDLQRNTGYPSRLIDMEMSLVAKALDIEEIKRNLASSLIGGKESLYSFAEVTKGEYIRNMPAGPALIIASGNSIIPTLIPTVISLVTGNFTFLKPSITNYNAVTEIFSGLRELMSKSPAARLMARSLCVSYLGHDSPGLKTALTSSPFGVVNYWGGEPGRSVVAAQVAQNPWHPKLFFNGPLTGVALIGKGADSEDVARGLAMNMVIYEQQLCSSPTIAAYLGEYNDALAFAERVGTHLDAIGSTFNTEVSNDALFVTHSARKILALKGSKVLASRRTDNPWTLAISPSRSNLDEVMRSFPSFNIHGRRRFLEFVVLKDMIQALDLISSIPGMKAYTGIDKVQTVGMALPESMRREALRLLPSSGAYRFVPIEDMFMRSAVEPYDGMPLAALFTYAVYERARPIPLEVGF
ncbi:MAG: acyl-CoA reductase [Methanomassiliicoccales archaeon]